MSNAREHFVLLVAGDNPSSRLNQFDKEQHKEKKMVYKKSDAKEILEKYKKTYEEFMKNQPPEEITDYITDQYNYLCQMSPEDFYTEVTHDMELDAEGNAWVYENPNAKFRYYEPAGKFANPLINKDDEEVYQAIKSDIAWDQIHMSERDVAYYARVWEMCVEGEEPRNEIEERAYKNMKERKVYFLNFENKETYVASNTSFWAYAFLGLDDKWVDFEDSGCTQFDWMTSFYDRFIKDLPEDTLITIYECAR